MTNFARPLRSLAFSLSNSATEAAAHRRRRPDLRMALVRQIAITQGDTLLSLDQ